MTVIDLPKLAKWFWVGCGITWAHRGLVMFHFDVTTGWQNVHGFLSAKTQDINGYFDRMTSNERSSADMEMRWTNEFSTDVNTNWAKSSITTSSFITSVVFLCGPTAMLSSGFKNLCQTHHCIVMNLENVMLFLLSLCSNWCQINQLLFALAIHHLWVFWHQLLLYTVRFSSVFVGNPRIDERICQSSWGTDSIVETHEIFTYLFLALQHSTSQLDFRKVTKIWTTSLT